MRATSCSSPRYLSIEPRGAPRGSGSLVLFTCRREVALRNVCVRLCVHVLDACACALCTCACACTSMCAAQSVCVHARAHRLPSGRGARIARKRSSCKPCRRTLHTQNQVSIMVQTGRGRTSWARVQGGRLRASIRCTQAQGGTSGGSPLKRLSSSTAALKRLRNMVHIACAMQNTRSIRPAPLDSSQQGA